jgi:hypothetical protein
MAQSTRSRPAQRKRAAAGSQPGRKPPSHRDGSNRASPRGRAGSTNRATRSTGNSPGDVLRSLARRAKAPMAAGGAAAAGVVGGMVLGSRLMPRRKVLGVPVGHRHLRLPISKPGRGGTDGVAREIARAGRSFSELAGEVRRAREQAEQVGKALS